MGELVSPILAKPKLYGRGGLVHFGKTKTLWARWPCLYWQKQLLYRQGGLAKKVLVFHEHEETFSS
jgi:hypothetical protein